MTVKRPFTLAGDEVHYSHILEREVPGTPVRMRVEPNARGERRPPLPRRRWGRAR